MVDEKRRQLLILADSVLEEISKTIIGKNEILAKIMMTILAGGHVLVEDIPGVGKTTMALAFAQSLGLKCNRVQFTPDVCPSDVVGFNMYNKDSGKFEYREGSAMCNILLADEINRTSPKTQSALLQAMEEGAVTVDGVTRSLPDPFFVIATQNPIGSVGTQKLPESQMDRFMTRLSMGYPEIDNEIEIMKMRGENRSRAKLTSITDVDGVKDMRQAVSEIYVDDSIYDYVARFAKATRECESIIQGISPRGSIAVISMAKACAFLMGRSYVLPSDVSTVVFDATVHRMVYAKNGGEEIVKEVYKKIKAPTIRK